MKNPKVRFFYWRRLVDFILWLFEVCCDCGEHCASRHFCCARLFWWKLWLVSLWGEPYWNTLIFYDRYVSLFEFTMTSSFIHVFQNNCVTTTENTVWQHRLFCSPLHRGSINFRDSWSVWFRIRLPTGRQTPWNRYNNLARQTLTTIDNTFN